MLKFLSTFALTFISFFAFAEHGESKQSLCKKCKEEIKIICHDKDGKKMPKVEHKKCIKDNTSRLSEECRNFIETKDKLRAGCKKELKEHCKDVKKNKKCHKKCLEENSSKLSEKCKASLKEIDAMISKKSA